MLILLLTWFAPKNGGFALWHPIRMVQSLAYEHEPVMFEVHDYEFELSQKVRP